MKKIFTLFILLIGKLAIVSATIYSGTCGTNLSWSLNTADSTLVITGDGYMDNYTKEVGKNIERPWKSCYNYIAYVQLPQGLKSIGEWAFANTFIRAVELPSTLTRVGADAFHACPNLVSIEIPDSVTIIGDFCFQMCNQLKKVEFGKQIHTIGRHAFSMCSSLNSILGGSVDSIGPVAFMDDSVLNMVSIEDGLQVIDTGAFNNCISLRHIDFPKSVRIIGTDAFALSGLDSIVCNEGLLEIHTEAFAGCSKLKSLRLSSTVSTIGKAIVGLCPKLTLLTVDNNNPIYYSPNGSNSIVRCSDNTLIQACPTTKIDPTINRIASGAFVGTSFTHLVFPNHIKVIEQQACWMMDSLRILQIGSGVDSIGNNAFGQCYSLDTIKCMASTPPILGESVWYDLKAFDIVLQVPNKSATLYQAAEQWKEFNIQPLLVDVNPITPDTTQLSWLPVDSASLYKLRIYSEQIELDTTLLIEADSLNGGISIPITLAPQRVRRMPMDDIGSVVVITLEPNSGATKDTPFKVTVSTKSKDKIDICFDLQVLKGEKTIKQESGSFALNAPIPDGLEDIPMSRFGVLSGIYDLYGRRYSHSQWNAMPAGIYILRDGEKTSKVMKR